VLAARDGLSFLSARSADLASRFDDREICLTGPLCGYSLRDGSHPNGA